MKAFYKKNGNDLLCAPNFVCAKNFELHIDKKDDYNYPVDDWYYFNTEQEAKDFFEIIDLENEENINILIEEHNLISSIL